MLNIIGEGSVKVGEKCNIGQNVSVVFKKNTELNIADFVTIGDNVKIVIENGYVQIGDWTTIHANSLLLCKTGLLIGRHCWFGQNSVIDGTGGLTIDDGVRVGMYSQIWTHVAAGELIEGCKLFSAKPTHIKRDAWLVGSC
jgi:carbonic anhydrase/acetyltransferase-like protein (isoleucine patch superfamily)